MSGDVTFTMVGGKEVKCRGDLTDTKTKDGLYLDVTKSGVVSYPSKLDFGKFKKVSSITFKGDTSSKKQVFTTWTYFNNGAWAVDRFTKLG
jgi:hypothetical protein